ncbi:FAD/NAD(P)-binding domain-containing protein [Viridothelium virens]|uniref:FAD/NAD(P)-binding domain-containing protein n=1 Tax=Viridothelium virens TaxID=1048519 RepID=A0A6A6H348_VIRVR|nr:FAD/NAD(P)-binding domain-containing protein [Viridothelium virens]
MHNVAPDRPVLIIGAGISGLALAQGLRLRAIPFRIFERYPKTRLSQGHRFRVSNNGVAALKSILPPDVRELFRLTGAYSAPFQPRYVDARELSFGERIRVENPDSMPIDRTWLRLLMMQGIEESIEYDRELSSYEVDSNTNMIKATFRDGFSVNGTMLVGADGIRSQVRKQFQPQRRLLDLERWITWGRTLLEDDLREKLPRDLLTWFMAIDTHANTQAVIEPIVWLEDTALKSEGRLPYFQDYLYWAVATESSPCDPNTSTGRKEFLEKTAKSWDPNLRLIFSKASHELSACAPIMSSKPDIEMGSATRNVMVTTVGDAAHSMSPMGGAGGEIALQGVADLLNTLNHYGVNVEAIRNYENAMELRVKPKLERSFANGRKFWKGKEWDKYEETLI